MQAGGPSSEANMDGITIRRGADVIWDSQDTRAALADGMSLDRLHLRAGDEIYLPAAASFPVARDTLVRNVRRRAALLVCRDIRRF